MQTIWTWLVLIGLTSTLGCSAGLAQKEGETDSLREAEEAYQDRELKKALGLVQKVCESEPKNADAWMLLGSVQLDLRANEEAAIAFEKVLLINDKLVAANDRLGDAQLKLGKFKEAIANYDKFLEANPRFAPQHWRRGIALYYAGRFKDGVEQFETHKTVNPQDVENAAWHYLCNVQVIGKEKSIKTLIDVTSDRRVPMAEIQKLFAGKLEVKDVLDRAEMNSDDSPIGISGRFYANLYVALWYEAEDKSEKVLEHLKLCVEKYKVPDYMWDVANAHLKMLQAKAKEKK